MYGTVLVIHILVAVVLILTVLVQSGRSGGLSGLMGGGGGDALFTASSQQSGLRKATVIMAVVFMFTSLGLTVLSSRKRASSVFDRPLPATPMVPDGSIPAEDAGAPTDLTQPDETADTESEPIKAIE